MNNFVNLSPVLQALIATLFTWAITALGAGMVFLTRNVSNRFLNAMLGFAAGVMVAASYWSLLAPSVELSRAGNMPVWIAPLIGFLLGGGVLWLIDRLLPHLHLGFPEADIEGATMIGRRIYWITSHGRNKEGKVKTSRYRFFATDVSVENGHVKIEPAGKPYKNLIHDLVKTDAGRRLGLNKATRFDASGLKKKEEKKLAPKEEGLNIEGLCATPDGATL